MLMLTVVLLSVILSVTPGSRAIHPGPQKIDTRQFIANLVTYMLWFLFHKDFLWEKDKGMVA
jgi:hypothetical protein